MGTAQSRRVLIAARPQARDSILHIMQSEFTLEFCDTVDSALRLLSQNPYGLVFCTLQFDSSRMFELLREMKAAPSMQDIPFVAIKIAGGILSDESVEHSLKAASLLGADECINLPEWRRQMGDEPAYAQLRDLLRQLLLR